MCAETLNVALVVPNIDAYSGAVERTVRLLEHASAAGTEYTVFLPQHDDLNAELAGDLERLAHEGRITLERLGSNGHAPRSFEAISIPTEYWWGARKRARAAGLRGPLHIEFHLLPYVGTLDVLRTSGAPSAGMGLLVRLPFAMRRNFAEGLAVASRETILCLANLRSTRNLSDGRVLAISDAIAAHMRYLGCDVTTYVPRRPNGIEASLVRASAVTEGGPVYDGIYVGRPHPQKGYLDLPKIVYHLRRHLRREVNVAVCGNPPSGAHRARFDDQVRELGVERNLSVLGRVTKSELYTAMRRSEILVYPSYVDGFPITILESLCLGLPVVGYDTDALRMIWGAEPAVVRTPVGDAEALARRIADLAGGGLEALRQAATRRSEALLREYTWENVARDQRRFFEGRPE